MPGQDLSIRQSRALLRAENHALVAMQQAQFDGAVRTARGIAKAQAITYVSRSAVAGLGDVAIEAEEVMKRSPWVAIEAADLTHRAARALGDVIDDVGRF